MMFTTAVSGQHIFHKKKAKHFKGRYKSQIEYYANACELLDKKKYQRPKSNPRLASAKVRYKPMAEVDPPGTTRMYQKETVETHTVATLSDSQSKSKAEITQQAEDKVLKENLLPVPTSEKHEEIRNRVAENLKNKKDNEPIELSPLYFNFNEDEFSVVDMEPFLIAVEYALQGKHILIEGHTDSQGADTYNVQLSIKRVQKIRQLMHDMGVPDDQISVVGYGEEHAVSAEIKKVDHQLDRRVDFKAF